MSDYPGESACSRPWPGQLLCRRYIAVYFNQVTAALVVKQEPPAVQHWAFGLFTDGESEVLGTWLQGALDPVPWPGQFDDLKERGVERVTFALSGDLMGFREGLRARFPGALGLPSFVQLIDRSVAAVALRHQASVDDGLRRIMHAGSIPEASAALTEFESSRWGAHYPKLILDWRLALEQGWVLWTLPPALRRAVLSGDGAAAALNRSLRKAVARHGCFADVDEAHAFVVAALARAERRLEASRASAVTEHNHHREGFRPRMDALGV